MKLKSYGVAFAALMAASTPAFATTESACEAINGTTYTSLRISALLSSDTFDEGDVITLSAENIIASTDSAHTDLTTYAAYYLTDASYATTSEVGIFDNDTGPVSVTLTVPEGGMTGLYYRESISDGGWYTTLTNATVTCGDASSFEDSSTQSEITTIAIAQQQAALTKSLNKNFANRFGGGSGNSVSRNFGFFSSQNLPGNKGDATEYSVWGSANLRYFDGSYDGYSVDVFAGVDKMLTAETLAGIVLGYGDLELDDYLDNTTTAESLMIGAYAAHYYASGIRADGYLAYAKVSYDTETESFDTDRVLLGLGVQGDAVKLQYGSFTPRLSLSGAWEKFPDEVADLENEIYRKATLSAGGRFDFDNFIPGTELNPYVSLAFEFTSENDLDDNYDTYGAPRVGFGVDGSVGKGRLLIGIDMGKASADVDDYGLELRYDLPL